MANLREELQIARINRTKTRTHRWWHETHCPACIAAKGGAVDVNHMSVEELMKRFGKGDGIVDVPKPH